MLSHWLLLDALGGSEVSTLAIAMTVEWLDEFRCRSDRWDSKPIFVELAYLVDRRLMVASRSLVASTTASALDRLRQYLSVGSDHRQKSVLSGQIATELQLDDSMLERLGYSKAVTNLLKSQLIDLASACLQY